METFYSFSNAWIIQYGKCIERFNNGANSRFYESLKKNKFALFNGKIKTSTEHDKSKIDSVFFNVLPYDVPLLSYNLLLLCYDLSLLSYDLSFLYYDF